MSGLVAAALGSASIGLGFRLLAWWMPRGYRLEPDITLTIVPLLGIYLAYKLGTGLSADSMAGDAGQHTESDGDNVDSADESSHATD